MQSKDHGGVTTFFQAYEQAIQTNDPALLSRIYAESFLFGGPSGSQSVKLDDFLKVIPQRAGFTKSLGLNATRLVSLTETAMDEHYTLVRVVWEMEVKKPDAEVKLLSAEASYVLRRVEDGFRIVAQIDHQDLVEGLRGL